jgi:hypothetical protein
VGLQDLAVSILLYRSAATESRENGDILPSERRRLQGLSALQEISSSLAERYTSLASIHDNPVDSLEVGATGDGLSESDTAQEIRR